MKKGSDRFRVKHQLDVLHKYDRYQGSGYYADHLSPPPIRGFEGGDRRVAEQTPIAMLGNVGLHWMTKEQIETFPYIVRESSPVSQQSFNCPLPCVPRVTVSRRGFETIIIDQQITRRIFADWRAQVGIPNVRGYLQVHVGSSLARYINPTIIQASDEDS
ncbi:hypothetical protein C8R44DRAFT_745332 [Mycena epipterygia]|nr:hypothetical protein C8R44DRAFT_745332 [Mycena epipterygia]